MDRGGSRARGERDRRCTCGPASPSTMASSRCSSIGRPGWTCVVTATSSWTTSDRPSCGPFRAAPSTDTSCAPSSARSRVRPGCQSTRLLRETDLAGWMARSPWRRPPRAREMPERTAAPRAPAGASRSRQRHHAPRPLVRRPVRLDGAARRPGDRGLDRGAGGRHARRVLDGVPGTRLAAGGGRSIRALRAAVAPDPRRDRRDASSCGRRTPATRSSSSCCGA